MMSLFSRSSVDFSECTKMNLRTLKIIKISWGSIPPDLPRVNNCRTAMFSSSANDIALPSPDGETYVRPCYNIFCFILMFLISIARTGLEDPSSSGLKTSSFPSYKMLTAWPLAFYNTVPAEVCKQTSCKQIS